MRIILLILGALSAAVVPATFLDTRALIEQALDEKPQVTLENVKLADALTRLTEQTGVRIQMAPEVMAMLPYGEDTHIQKVELANIPLRRGLTELFGPLGMTFEVRDNHVAVLPKVPVMLLGRPATWEELTLLSDLSAMQPGVNAAELESLRNRVQFQVIARDPWPALAEAIRAVGAGPGDEVLTFACGNLGWTWRLSGNRITIAAYEQQYRMQLLLPITLRVNSRPLFDTVYEVGRQVNVPIRVDSAEATRRLYSLNVSNAPAEQVLAKIAAETGLTYVVDSSGVVFFAPNSDSVLGSVQAVNGAVSATTAGPGEKVIGILHVNHGPGHTIEWVIRESELPDDLRDVRERDLQEFFERVRQMKEAPAQP